MKVILVLIPNSTAYFLHINGRFPAGMERFPLYIEKILPDLFSRTENKFFTEICR